MSTYTVVQVPGARLPESYRPLIFSKWLRSLRFGNDYFKLIDADAYYRAYHRYIEGLLTRDGATVRLAVLTDTPDVVLGFSVVDGPVLHYCHVHKDMRKQGIGRSLIPQGINVVTHLTKTGLSIWGSKMPGVTFNPFA